MDMEDEQILEQIRKHREAMATDNRTPIGLHAKLAEIMAEVGRIPKRGTNDYHKYQYAMEADIVEAVRGGLSSRGVSCIPSIQSVTREGSMTTALMTFTLTDGTTGETVAATWAGTGDDKGDKGLYKAMTGALKYFLLKTFLMPTGDDPEADTGTDKRAEKRGKTSAPAWKCQRCASTDKPETGDFSEPVYCATCQRLQAERSVQATYSQPPQSGAAPRGEAKGSPAPKPSVNTAKNRTFALLHKYGLPTGNDASASIERRAYYGKALGLDRMATEDEAKKFTAAQWETISTWLIDRNEPPPEADAPLGIIAGEQ